jgi:acetyl-CoA C-acetyltransferase
MTRVAISGCGMTDFGRLGAPSAVELAVTAGREALDAAGIDAAEVDALYLSTFATSVLGGQNFAAAVTASHLGLRDVPAVAVEGACASGSVALRQALNLVAAGGAQAVLVVGTEKMTAQDTETVTDALAAASDISSGAFRAGLSFPGFFALLAAAYLDRYGLDRDQLASVSVKNRANGALNRHAQFRQPVTADTVLSSRPIAEPLRLFDCSPISDGAAALVVSTLDWAREHADQPIEVLACEQASGPTAPERIADFTTVPAAAAAARRAYARAGISPEDVSVAEVHDCFTIAEVIAIEDLGFFGPGEGMIATAEGETEVGARLPVNPSGGLLSKGHPVGATGVSQVLEIVRQLRGDADNQVGSVDLGLTHNVGGSGGLASVTILARAQ